LARAIPEFVEGQTFLKDLPLSCLTNGMKAFRPFEFLSLSTVLVALLAGTGCTTVETSHRSSRQDELLAAREVWYKSFNQGNTEEMDRLETNDFLVMSGFGVETKDEQLRGIKARVEAKNWKSDDSKQVTEDLRVRFYGDAAIVTGRGWTKTRNQTDPPKEQFLLTEVWLERDGRWSVCHLHFHQTPRP
jgi:ketosteroid isomerase-like protein